ncbi:hypothetical protein M3484_22450 [Pseudomonas sp. GX19020]|uniref:hypothetical protein n=1 Tax=Pseudomonas sp. GX19020 TaxID=2942277 RepID=UPI002018DE5F|nr:hypothetical protein [Pseudomonas sp. GX19020]MCL4069323.1 hypothetical protein [Pseudomonas sp. GX19020]
MSHEIIRRVNKTDDATVVSVFERICKILSETPPNIYYSYIPGVNLSPADIDRKKLKGRFNFTDAKLSIKLDSERSITINFRRQIVAYQGSIVPSAKFDEFVLRFGQNSGNWASRNAEVQQVFDIVGGSDADPTYDEASENSDAFRAVIDGFSATHRQMLDTLDERIKLADERRVEADDLASEREASRRDEHRLVLEQIEAERAKLSLQSHMAERRRLLETLSQTAREQAAASQLPRGANAMRWGVFFASLAVSGVAGALSFQSFAALSADSTHTAIDWILLTRGIIGSVVAVGAAVYAAGWLKSFYEADAKAARDLQQFNYDLSRASWIIETVLEVQHEKKGEVPREWIEGVTHGLFDRAQPGASPDEGAQALGALLGFAGSASFGPEGARIDVGRNGARRLAKAIKSGEAGE